MGFGFLPRSGFVQQLAPGELPGGGANAAQAVGQIDLVVRTLTGFADDTAFSGSPQECLKPKNWLDLSLSIRSTLHAKILVIMIRAAWTTIGAASAAIAATAQAFIGKFIVILLLIRNEGRGCSDSTLSLGVHRYGLFTATTWSRMVYVLLHRRCGCCWP